jgi:hypothetical protein
MIDRLLQGTPVLSENRLWRSALRTPGERRSRGKQWPDASIVDEDHGGFSLDMAAVAFERAVAGESAMVEMGG